MENKLSQLIKQVQRLPEDCLDDVIDYINGKIEDSAEGKPAPPCPHCKDEGVTKFGFKHGKQRYRCKGCGKTFLATTNTAMYNSRFGEAVWRQVVRDTVDGIPIDETAEAIGASHTTAFLMRHKVLLSLEAEECRKPTVLDGVCELDDTYVLESLKGTGIPEDYWRKARKHGAKAKKRGVSSEYIAISTGLERDGQAYSKSVTRATPGKDDVIAVFGNHIGQEALILCDGAKSYAALGETGDYPVQNVCADGSKAGKGFYNINTSNSFHGFIKDRYIGYKGVATKYLNRYNALFSKAFRCSDDLADEIYNMLSSSDSQRFHSVVDVKALNLLEI